MKATIALLTFNGDEFLDEVLDACLVQVAPFEYEVLVIDSGSSDRTLEIISRHEAVRLEQIPNSEFGHGRTRNLAASLAEGDIVVFLTQDATPDGPGWLVDLVRPFREPDVAGAYGGQKPRPSCCPAVSRDVVDTFRNPPRLFFSNVNSAIRRPVLRDVPFRDVDYAEDRAFAQDAATAGYRTVYVPEAVVRHSHDLRLGDYFRRMYDEACGVRQTSGLTKRHSAAWLMAAALRGTVKDWVFVVSDRSGRPAATGKWVLMTPLYNGARRLAIWLAFLDRLPPWLARRLSLEFRRRNAAAQVTA